MSPPFVEQPADRGPRVGSRLRLFAGVWLVYLLAPLSQVVERMDGWRQALGITLLAAFCVIYLALLPKGFRLQHPVIRRSVPWILLLISLLLMPLAGESALICLVFVAVAFLASYSRNVAYVAVIGLLVLAVALPYLVDGWARDGVEQGIQIALAATVIIFMIELVRANAKLREAQEENAELAVLAERERFARDLHDTLGHSLTVITKKAELARRLTEVAPEQAAREIAEVEQLSREALRDVRATVTGVRETTLVDELATAGQSLAAAGIAADLPADIPDLPVEHRVLFGWAVREGVTNVLRHSGARHCRISVSPTRLEVVDDGSGRPADGATSGAAGHGLRGLTERAAAVGGTVEAGPIHEGGFRLAVSAGSA